MYRRMTVKQLEELAKNVKDGNTLKIPKLDKNSVFVEIVEDTPSNVD